MTDREETLAAEFASASSKLSKTETAFIKGWLAGRVGSKENQSSEKEVKND